MNRRGGQRQTSTNSAAAGRTARLGGSESVGAWAGAAHAAAALLGRKWVLAVLGALATRPLRRFQLAVRVKGISPKVLTETLRLLEREDLVERVLVHESDGSVGVAYELTSLGRSLDQPVAVLARWYVMHDQARAGSASRRDRLSA